MRKVCVVVAAFMLLSLSVFATADVFNMGGTRNPDGSWTGLASLETVTVGDPGNTGELSGEGAGGYGPDRICGSVGYTYNIGKYEVTAGQYTAFLNAVAKVDTYGLYNSSMWDSDYGCKIERTGTIGNYSYRVASDRANRPVNYVSFWDACRFANWLHNGQPTGAQDLTTTEDGAYLLNGYTGYDGRWIVRKAGWRWAVTSEDEWYKAAYYKGGGTNAGYWSYPTQSDTMPSNQLVDPTRAITPPTTTTATDIPSAARTGEPRSALMRTRKARMARSTRAETCGSGTRPYYWYMMKMNTLFAVCAVVRSPASASTCSRRTATASLTRIARTTTSGSESPKFLSRHQLLLCLVV
jgi:hypothetical protein